MNADGFISQIPLGLEPVDFLQRKHVSLRYVADRFDARNLAPELGTGLDSNLVIRLHGQVPDQVTQNKTKNFTWGLRKTSHRCMCDNGCSPMALASSLSSFLKKPTSRARSAEIIGTRV